MVNRRTIEDPSRINRDGITRFQGALLFDASTRSVITDDAIINHSLLCRAERLVEMARRRWIALLRLILFSRFDDTGNSPEAFEQARRLSV